jgi:hypothetical protein
MKGKLRRIGGIALAVLMLFGVGFVSANDVQAQGQRRRVIIVRPFPHRIYRPFRWGGYPYWGYDPWSPYGFRYRQYVFDNSDDAVNKGYENGFKTGKDDGKKAKSYDPQRSHYYKEAGFGNFAEVYRDGFSRGYQDGFRTGGDERTRKNAG